MHAPDFDICACGDYRHQHEGAECRTCAECPRFRLVSQLVPTWRDLDDAQREAVMRQVGA